VDVELITLFPVRSQLLGDEQSLSGEVPLRLVAAATSERIPPASDLPNDSVFIGDISQRGKQMSVLQINWNTFLMQITGLAIWVLLAAAIYALVENYIDGRRPR
jgi:hypothetical protein